jgi:tripartite motif-containing protein 71
MNKIKFLLQAQLVCLLAACRGNTLALSSTNPVELVWKINSDPNPFKNPYGLALDEQGNLYVGDDGNNRIVKFDSNGHFITQWGSFGKGNGQFAINDPGFGSVAVSGQGAVYITDTSNARIEKFDLSGQFLSAWGTQGTGDGQFNQVDTLAVDRDGNVYVSEYLNHRIQKFDPSGKFLAKWGNFGAGHGQFNDPEVAVDEQGNIFEGDAVNLNIQKADSHGQFLVMWDTCGNGKPTTMLPWGVALDIQGDVYVTDHDNNRVCKYDGSGRFLTSWSVSGGNNDKSAFPGGIVVDKQGNVYVADFNNRPRFRWAAPAHPTASSAPHFLASEPICA